MRSNTLARRGYADPERPRAQPAGRMAGLATSSETAMQQTKLKLAAARGFCMSEVAARPCFPPASSAFDTRNAKPSRHAKPYRSLLREREAVTSFHPLGRSKGGGGCVSGGGRR